MEIEKNLLNDLVELLEEEKQTIDEKLQSVEKENSAGEEERIKLADQNEDLKSVPTENLIFIKIIGVTFSYKKLHTDVKTYSKHKNNYKKSINNL